MYECSHEWQLAENTEPPLPPVQDVRPAMCRLCGMSAVVWVNPENPILPDCVIRSGPGSVNARILFCEDGAGFHVVTMYTIVNVYGQTIDFESAWAERRRAAGDQQ